MKEKCNVMGNALKFSNSLLQILLNNKSGKILVLVLKQIKCILNQTLIRELEITLLLKKLQIYKLLCLIT